MRKYSRQREVIRQVLASTDTHPTAADLYESIRKVLPRVSLGTVYRNLAQLRDGGEILSLSVGDGCERFDARTRDHLHLCCTSCGSIKDAPLDCDPAQSVPEGEFLAGIGVYVIYGICKDCLINNKFGG